MIRPALAFAFFFASLSVAAAKEVKTTIKPDPASFGAQRAEIENSFRTDAYSELTRTQREQVTEALDRIEALLRGVRAVSELEEKQRIQLFNDQDYVNTTLTKARADSRTICRRETRVGSHRPTTRCNTVAEIRRERESSQSDLREHQRSHMRPPGGQ